MEDLEYQLQKKIKVLNETLWEQRAKNHKIEEWLSNFRNKEEELHALFLLSHFMYFGEPRMKEMLQALYRDLYKYPIIENIRKENNDTLDGSLIDTEFSKHLRETRFLGVGNPSESGVHLLYYFRQENGLAKELFINTHEILDFNLETGQVTLKPEATSINHLVFIDDFCGSGTQASRYSQYLGKIKKENPSLKISYLMLFATTSGRNEVKTKTEFDNVDCVFELDDSFKVFDENSRVFVDRPEQIDVGFTKAFCERDGKDLMTGYWSIEGRDEETAQFMGNRDKLGYKGCDLLIGFHHNTPTNTLPIIWYDEEHPKWKPIFKRYNKIYRMK